MPGPGGPEEQEPHEGERDATGDEADDAHHLDEASGVALEVDEEVSGPARPDAEDVWVMLTVDCLLDRPAPTANAAALQATVT